MIRQVPARRAAPVRLGPPDLLNSSTGLNLAFALRELLATMRLRLGLLLPMIDLKGRDKVLIPAA